MSRILIDCTYVFEHPGDNSGIQRVVRNVVEELPHLGPEFDARPVILRNGSLLEVLALRPKRRERLLAGARNLPHQAYVKIGRAAERWGGKLGLGAGGRFRMRATAGAGAWLATSVLHGAWLIGPVDLEQTRLRRLKVRPGDQLVLLDSSWHYDLSPLERLKSAGVRIVPVIHDLVPITHPQFCVDELVRVFKGWFARTATLADGFLSISQATEDALKAYLRQSLGPERVQDFWFEHFHHGARLDLAADGKPARDVLAAFEDGKSVYLAVGTIEPRKNHAYVLAAFERLWSQGVDVKLCLIGKFGWKSDRLMNRIRTHPELNSRLFMFERADDASLAYAYRHARALVFPSHLEGFGLPMIEAMQHGLPVMASDISIFREIGGEYVAYFDQTAPESLAELVRQFETDGLFPAKRDLSDWRWHGWRDATRDIVAKVRAHAGHKSGIVAGETVRKPKRIRQRLTRFQRALAKADSLRDRKLWPAAARAYERALRVEPNHPDIWIQHGHAVKEAGQMHDALISYERASTMDPQNVDAALQLGHCLQRAGQGQKAATQFLRALEIDPGLTGCGAPLGCLGQLSDGPQLTQMLSTPPPEPGTIYLDLLDVIEYFGSGRRPTGIQRVQLELVKACLDEGEAGPHRLCFFVRERLAFVELPWTLLEALYDATRVEGDTTSAIQDAHGKIRFYANNAPTLRFPKAANLLSLGPVWTIKDYFDVVRRHKTDSKISYGTIVYDLIPLKCSMYCDDGTVGSYQIWLTEALNYCDFFVSISESTKKDLLAASAFLQIPLAPSQVTVMPLDADFTGQVHADPASVLARLGIEKEFVLLVGTLEPRKNHRAAFEAWDILAKSGSDQVPLLVCAGKWGWKTDDIVEALNKTKGRVLVVSDLSDDELGVLYRNAMFTLLPSFYEGWGLPITEALCHGSPVLAAENSSLPEAGGKSAIYFDAADPEDLAAKARGLIADQDRLQQLRQTIEAEYHPRTWSMLLKDIDCAVSATKTSEPRKALESVGE